MKRGKAYIRGVIGSPDGVLPSFVRCDPPVPFMEQGSEGGFTRGFKRFDGLTAQLAFDDLTTFRPCYPGDATDGDAIDNMVDQGIYPTPNSVPVKESQRHVDRVRAKGADGDHYGEVTAARQSDLLMRAGKTHYPTPDDFISEAIDRGISKAIPVSQRQRPPVVAPGTTRCWIVHPRVDRDGAEGWAVIGYAYLQEVVYTLPEDGNVPQYVQEYQAAGALDVVDIEAPSDDDDDAPAELNDFGGDDDQPDADGSDDPADDGDADQPDADGSDDAITVQPSDGADDLDVSIDTWDDPDADGALAGNGDIDDQDLRDLIESTDYNTLRAAAAALDVDAGQSPTTDDLADALLTADDHDPAAVAAEITDQMAP